MRPPTGGAARCSPEDMCNASCTTRRSHLVRVFDLKEASFSEADQFVEAMVRLAAATDVADELLQRVATPGRYPAWAKGQEARGSWRDAHGHPLREMRRYRNRLLHRNLLPYQAVRQMERVEAGVVIPVEDEALRFPKIGREGDYLDWRTLGRLNSLVIHRDFAYAERIVNDAWAETLAYFEQEWNTNLVPNLVS